MKFEGLSAFPITPCAADGQIDGASLRNVLTPLLDARVDSIGLLGSTGVYAFLSRAERRRALELAIDQAGGRTPILVGVGALRTDDAVRLACDAKAIGAAAGLLAPVSYTPLTDDEVFEHFATVARESALPLCIYDNPTTTHFTIRPALVSRLSRIPGVVAIKSAAPPAAQAADHIEAQRGTVPKGFSVGFAMDWQVTEALIAGADAWYSVAAGVFPVTCSKIVTAVRQGDVVEARRLDGMLHPLWALFQEFSSIRVVYAALEALGRCRTSPPRPILPLPEPASRHVAAVVQQLGLS